MVASYLEALQSLLGRVGPNAEPSAAITCKHFFAGAAAYADGRIFMTWTPIGLALKLPQASRDAWLEKGATALRYFPNGPIKKQYIVVPGTLHQDEALLAPLVRESIGFARKDS